MTAIRDAMPADDDAILAILNHEVREDVNSWQHTEFTKDAVTAWREHARFPLLVAEARDRVIGFGRYGSFRSSFGYIHTVEHSVYVAHDARGDGAGRALLIALIDHAERAGDIRVMIGGFDSGNAASARLHVSLGFEEVGRLPQVGRKFDRWLDLVLTQKLLP